MLKKITIENYRSCFNTSFEFHPNLSVLIGPNGSGKTNVLQAIMLLHRMAQREGRYERKSIGGAISRLRVGFSLKNAQIRLSASVETQTDDSNKDIVTRSRHKWVVTSGSKKRIRSEVPLGIASKYPRLHPSYDEVPENLTIDGGHRWRVINRGYWLYEEIPDWARGSLLSVSSFCARLRYYGASQFTNPGACPVSFEIEKDGEERRLYRLTGHAKILYQMYSAWRNRSQGKFPRFLDIVGPGGLQLIDGMTFKEVQTSSVNYTVKVGGKVEKGSRRQLLVIPQFRIGRQRLSPNQLSEGTFKTLALLFHVVTDESSALLIEEPEVCIHHGLLSSVLEIIRSYSQKKQMIISTHSDHVLDYVQPENVFRVSHSSQEGTSVKHIRKTLTAKEFVALRHYLESEGNLGEYWREGGLEEIK
jgi:ABC-type lipoprotein export system ATPase subunit